MPISRFVPVRNKRGDLFRWAMCALINAALACAPSLAEAQSASSVSRPGSASEASRVPAWLPWTFTGLGAASAVTAFVAWRLRESHVERWNSAACLEPGLTRAQVCANDYFSGRDAETVTWVTGIGSVAFLGTAFFLGRARASVSADSSSLRVAYSGTF